MPSYLGNTRGDLHIDLHLKSNPSILHADCAKLIKDKVQAWALFHQLVIINKC